LRYNYLHNLNERATEHSTFPGSPRARRGVVPRNAAKNSQVWGPDTTKWMLAEIEDFIEGINRPIHSRYADQRPACLYIVIPARMVWGYKARGRVDHPMTRLLQRQCKSDA
jgi:hypothetical protein